MAINKISIAGGGSFEFNPEPQRKTTEQGESNLPDFADYEVIDAEVVNNPLKDIQLAPETASSLTAPLETEEILGEIMPDASKQREVVNPTEISDKIKQERKEVTPKPNEDLLNDPFLVELRAELKGLDYNEKLLFVNP